MSDDNDPMLEIRASFFLECDDLIEALQDGLEALADGSNDDETINVIFRAVHSIKGGAGAFGLTDLVQFAHRYETALDEVRSDRVEATPQDVKLFFRAADFLADLIRISRDGGDLNTSQRDELLGELDAMIGEDGGAEEANAEDFQPLGIGFSLDLDLDGVETMTQVTVNFHPHPELFASGNEPLILLRNLAELGTVDITCNLDDLPLLADFSPEASYLSWQIALETASDEDELRSLFDFIEGTCDWSLEMPEANNFDLPPLPDPIEPPAEATPLQDDGGQPVRPATKSAEPAKPASVVRVDLERVERLVNLVGELVINQAMLSQSLGEAGLSQHSDAMNGLEEYQRLTRDIQDSVMLIRAQPVKSLFQRMSRIVREASASVDKDVRLVTVGETTEVDKTVIERLADPLTHMIRNAVDHGLERPEDRVAAGKPPEGVLHLTAQHRSGRVVIEVADDGAGINRERVLAIAVERGLVPEDVVLGDSEIDNLLFMPGFSTASSISDISGRGVGMDVVRTAIQSLGGRIAITSEPGKGTTFSISLPLTLAVLEGMVVDVAGETLVFPLNSVIETLAMDSTALETLPTGQSVLRVRGQFVPMFDLGYELGYRDRRDSMKDAIVLLTAQENEARAALLIDAIHDQRQVVIKGLSDAIHRAPGIAAATILGDGQIALILDPSDIITNAMSVQRSRQISLQESIS